MENFKAESPIQDLAKPSSSPNTQLQKVDADKKQNIVQHNIFKTQLKKTNIFNQNNQSKISFNIFQQEQTNTQKNNIFAQKDKSVNLFEISTVPQTQHPNIFKTASKPLIKTLNNDDDKSSSNASSSLVNKVQSQFKTRPQKLEMKFNYENPWRVIKTYNLRKFKSGGNSSKQHIYLTFEKHSENSDKVYIFVRARQTKILLFQGFGLANISDKVSSFMNKEENLKFYAIRQHKKQQQDDDKPQFTKEELKIQFENVEDANDFKQFMQKEYCSKEADKQEEK